ncbi:MAG: FAA hydrolase family protein [Desulfobulbaceae bacterium]|nr:FAA hydrolase family protein [Desulfobulbaceae bacterium]
MSSSSSTLVFSAPPLPVVRIRGTDLQFPVNRIFCVGRNYEAHAKEMGMAVDREAPFYFTKSASCIVASGSTVAYAPGTSNLHHEMELVVAIGKPAFCVTEEDAPKIIYGYACGLDMSRRDLQFKARDKGRPWDLGKNFENSAVISEIVTVSETGLVESGDISLSVNKEPRQSGNISDLIWNVPELIADLSKYYHLQPGDLLYTGTPAGVGPVEPGDVITGSIDQVGEIEFTIAG